jgi:hypothetical protein
MGSSSKKVARRPGVEMMWPSGVGSHTCNHKGSSLGGVRQYPIEHACLRQYPIEQDFRGSYAHGCVQHPGATAHSCCD